MKDYGIGIQGTLAGYGPQTYQQKFEGLASKQLYEQLRRELLSYPEISIYLNHLTPTLQLTTLAKTTLIKGIEIQYDKLFNGMPKWKLEWYEEDFTPGKVPI